MFILAEEMWALLLEKSAESQRHRESEGPSPARSLTFPTWLTCDWVYNFSTIRAYRG